jgi:hypothetical protein
MLEFPDADERRVWLQKLIGVEDRVWLQVEGHEKVWAIADEDLDRETDQKTSSVHFLRFELDKRSVTALKAGSALQLGVDHPSYRAALHLTDETRDALVKDLA